MADLPSGTVTFLFTDVESSTQLLQAHAEAYRAAIHRHHDLLQRAVEANGGVVFETVGDAVYAAFNRPTDAVKAALQGQLALHREAWDETPMSLRRALHDGEVERRGHHYFGVPLHVEPIGEGVAWCGRPRRAVPLRAVVPVAPPAAKGWFCPNRTESEVPAPEVELGIAPRTLPWAKVWLTSRPQVRHGAPALTDRIKGFGRALGR